MKLFDWLFAGQRSALPTTAQQLSRELGLSADVLRQAAQVDQPPDVEALFDKVRRLTVGLGATGSNEPPEAVSRERVVVVLTPGANAVIFAMPKGTYTAADAALGERILPARPQKQIAVISNTIYPALRANATACIPFLGYLMNFAWCGHLVWIFEGHPSRLAAGCRNADILWIDSGIVPSLPTDWKEVASSAMRGNEVWIHDRQRYELQQSTLGNIKADAGRAAIRFYEPPVVLAGEAYERSAGEDNRIPRGGDLPLLLFYPPEVFFAGPR